MDTPANRGSKLFEPLTSMAPHQMAISALLAVAAIVAIMGMWQWSTAPSYQALLVGEDPAVVSESITELEAAGIDYRVSDGGTRLEVQRDRVSDAEVRLASAGISASSVDGYELLDRQGFSTSSFQQRINYQRALEGELTRTIMDLDQVLAASVHLSIPEDELFTDEEEAPTASVVIDTTRALGSQAVDGIVNVVASAVPGMSPDGVTVTDTSGRVLTSTGTDATNDALATRRSLEQQLEASAQSMLMAAFGHENAFVRVSAELDLDDSEKETVTYNPDSQIALREQVISEEYTGTGESVGGVVGTTSEVTTGASVGDEAGRDYARSEQTSEFGVDRVRTVERNSSGDITRLSVAVVVNRSLDPPPDLAQVSEVVAAAVGLDPERGDVIAVEAIAFDESFAEQLELPPIEEPAGDPLEAVAPYMGVGRTALAVVLLLLVLLSLRKGVKSFTASLRPVEATVIDLDELSESTDDDEPEESDAAAEETLELPSGPMSPDDVRRIIDQQPVEVASLLRGWANEAVSN